MAGASLRAPLALTMGDPAGIGLEIAAEAWARRVTENLPPFVMFADPEALRGRARAIGRAIDPVVVASPREGLAQFPSRLPVVRVRLAEAPFAGQPSQANAPATIASIEAATAAVFEGHASAVVTNPISKAVLKAAGFAHPGHTEFMAELATRHAGGAYTPVMMLAARELRVVPLTVHVPLIDVPRLVTNARIIEVARILAQALKRDFGIAAPRIAVAGLNPHAGEDGMLGGEEIATIRPALAELLADGVQVSGPHPADTLFHEAARKNYDAVLAMYHDQALIPLKTLAFDRGVNITLGLPFVRTSPDHGTAFDIAGRGIASATSLIEALKSAAEIASNRARASAGVAS